MSAAFDPADFSPAALTVEALRAKGEPELFERDVDVWKVRLVAWFEEASGRTLYPDQTEMFLIEMAAYAFALHGEDGHGAIIQNLAIFSEGDWLELLAANASITKLPAAQATMAVQAALPKPASRAVTVSKGTILAAGDVRFSVNADIVIATGETTASGVAGALVAGVQANGIQPGQASAQLGSIATGLSLTNTSVSAGGSDAESDDHLRLVTVDAPEQFDRRGGWGGYGLAVRRVHPDIADVAIDRPQPGHIHIIIAMANGEAPGQALLDEIAARLDKDTVVPHGDYVTDVRGASAHDVDGTLTIRLSPGVDAVAARAAALAGAQKAIDTMRRPNGAGSSRTQFAPEVGRLGAQIAPAAIIAAAMAVPGVIDATLDGVAYLDLPFDKVPQIGTFSVVSVSGADV